MKGKVLLIICIALFLFTVTGACAGDLNDDATGAASEVDPYSNDEITIESDDAGLYEASDDIKENDLTVPKDTTPETFIENKVVTNATFFYYFDNSGELLDSVTSDELIFEGSFNGLEIKQITINRPIKFTGNSSTFEDVAFRIDSDNVTID